MIDMHAYKTRRLRIYGVDDCFLPYGGHWRRLSRTILVLMMVSALAGTWVVEQPHSSLVVRHRRFRSLVRAWRKMGVRVSWIQFPPVKHAIVS